MEFWTLIDFHISDFHKSFEEFESPCGDQSDDSTTLCHQCLRHQPCGALGLIPPGESSLCKLSVLFIIAAVICVTIKSWWMSCEFQGGPSKEAQAQLSGLFNSIASFFHPSNHGRWLVSGIYLFIYCFYSFCMIKELKKHKPFIRPPIRKSAFLIGSLIVSSALTTLMAPTSSKNRHLLLVYR